MPLFFLRHATQGNQFRVGSLVLAGAWNAGGFSAVKLFHNLWYKACHPTGHSFQLKSRTHNDFSAQTHILVISKNHYNADFRHKIYENIQFKEGLE